MCHIGGVRLGRGSSGGGSSYNKLRISSPWPFLFGVCVMHHCPVQPGTFRCSWQLKSPRSTCITESVLRMDCNRLFNCVSVSCVIDFCFLPLWGMYTTIKKMLQTGPFILTQVILVPTWPSLMTLSVIRGDNMIHCTYSCHWIRALTFFVHFCGHTTYPFLEFLLCVV